MEQMRLEVAREFGLDGARAGYLGEATCVQCGKYGHVLYKRAQQLLQDGSADSKRTKSSEVPKNRRNRKGQE